MTSISAVNLYLGANTLLVVGGLLITAIRFLSARFPRPIRYRQQLRCAYAITLVAIVMPLHSLLLPASDFAATAAQVWSAPSMHGIADSTPQRATIAVITSPYVFRVDTVSVLMSALLLTGMLTLLVRTAAGAFRVIKLIRHAHTIRHIHRLHILATDHAAVAFSFWLPRKSFIVIPSTLLTCPADLRMALRHEGQHHRQLDTCMLHVYASLKAVFFWNPAFYWIERSVLALQEFACDEALLQHPKTSPTEYAACLTRIASDVVQRRRAPLCASMSGSTSSSLVQRIESLLSRPLQYQNKHCVSAIALSALIVMTATSAAFSNSVIDRRISRDDARRMASVASNHFPISINDRVLTQLNRFVGTPDGRAYFQATMARMAEHRAIIAAKLSQSHLPLELLAVPMIESGYQNLAANNDPRRGAGLWMFIRSTALHYGLQVNSSTDERLDVAAETDAAVRYFAALHAQFNDWELALLAYNSGSKQVEKAIRETGSRDVWEITRSGYENDRDYLPKVVAAILILKNPAVLE